MLIELRAPSGDLRALLSVKRASLSMSLSEAEVYTYDQEGRLLTAWVNDQTFIRTLDNRIVKKWRDPAHPTPWKMIKELEADEAQQLLKRISRQMNGLLQQLQRGQMNLIFEKATKGPSPDQAREWLGKIAAWDCRRLEKERERFLSVYTPVTILPPDQYLGLVLQATEGCHWNRCTFCHFYRHSEFRIKTEEEFGLHIGAVKEFFGAAIRLRHSIFLGDANALVIPQERLLRIFDRINRELPTSAGGSKLAAHGGHFFQGIYSFIDAFTGDKKSAADFRELRARNLRRVYMGVETGCDELLRFLNKPATAEQTLETIKTIKRGGLSVGAIILIGVGGDRYLRPHVEQTIKLLNNLKLGQGDIIYFSPLVESPMSPYIQGVTDAGIRSLTDEERREQLRAIRSGLRFAGDERPKVALYDIREFVY